MIKTISIILTNEKDEILLLKRSPNRKRYPNVWSIVSGKVNPEEEPDRCFARELKEETGIISYLSLEKIAAYVYKETDRTCLVYPYRCLISTKQEIKLNEEHCQYKFFTIEQILNLTRVASPLLDELGVFYPALTDKSKKNAANLVK